MAKGIIDGDWLCYAASYASEKRSIKVTKIDNGKSFDCDNRTAFWGTKKKEIGGILGNLNATRISKGLEPYTKEDFLIEDVQTLKGPLANTLHSVKVMMDNALKIAGCDSKEVYVGKGDSFRVERSTVLKYKGNRDLNIKPLLKQEVTDYLIRQHGAEVVTDVEADDVLVWRAYKKDDHVVISHDKDALGTPCLSFNPQKPELGVQDGNQFGRLYLDDKGGVRGLGRLFLYHQINSGDSVDNYKANSASDIKWGEKSSYDVLKECKTDQEALQALVNTYQYLYPTEKEITGWRGDLITVNAQYMLEENWAMARMLRFEGDGLTAAKVLGKYGITF